ncbi:MAG: hypothetical protein Tsb009_12320 [Planctomycetaceae bacterium]
MTTKIAAKKPAAGQINPPESLTESSLVIRKTSRKRTFLIGLSLLIAIGFTWWKTYAEDRFVPKRFGVVVPGTIYRSGQISKWQIENVLLKYNIKGIIDFQGFDWNEEHQQAELAVAWKYKIAVNRFPQSGDGTGNIVHYAEAIRIMSEYEAAGKPLLVHCAAGSQRTGAVVAFYRLLVQKKSPQEALKEMARYDCEPAENMKLIHYMNNNMEKLAQLLVERNVIETVPDPIPQLQP